MCVRRVEGEVRTIATFLHDICEQNESSVFCVAVTNRDQPTPVAFLLLRMVIGPDGELTPKLNTGIRESVKVCTWVRQ